MVRVRDLDASLKFYCDLLGLEEVSRNESAQGRFTLVFLCAPGDTELARERRAPMVELTYNWDAEDYQGGRNFGHLAYAVDDIYVTCQRLEDGGVTISRPPRDGRATPGRPGPGARRALGLNAQCRGLVIGAW